MLFGFSVGVYPGANVLVKAGLAAIEENADKPGVASYPRMQNGCAIKLFGFVFFGCKRDNFGRKTFKENRMKKSIFCLAITILLSLAVFAQQTPKPPSTHLKVGDAAPDFTLNDTEGKTVKLSDYKGKKSVVLAFYVLAFTGG